MTPLYLISFILLSATFTMAAPANYETQLMKLSKSLKGEPASLQDRAHLKTAISENRAEEFLKTKTQEYVNAPRFTFKLKQKVDELVRVVAQQYEIRTETPYSKPSAYDLLVDDTILNNRSWDELLTAKSYRSKTGGNFLVREKDFFAMLTLQSEQTPFEKIFDPEDNTTERIYQFDPADQRIAGILTTPRFFERYVNTALNKNRRRAAAVFRIFMCDSMIPTVPAQDANSEKLDYDRIFPDHKNFTEGEIRQSLAGNVHGEQADCMSCHYKLDPLGQVFAFSAANAGSKASPGALRFRGHDGRKVDIPLRGFGDLATAIVQQPEYVKCQVENFWRWYIGKDVPLTTAREENLIQVFNNVGRKPKDFVAYLVSLPEFKEKPQLLTEDQLLARRVTKIFKNCNSCHESTGEAVWDLTDLPYHKDERRREKMLKKLSNVLDLPGNGRNAEMPPEDSLWKLSPDEFDLIKTWLQRGAPDYQGTPQVKPGGI